MSRLTDLIASVKSKDSELGSDLDREFKALSSRLHFGLNFERHRPEAVELPLRKIRKGDKVRILPPRGSTKKGDQRLWFVKNINRKNQAASIELIGYEEPEEKTVEIAELVVVSEFKDIIYPGLVSTGKVVKDDNKPFHTVINGENFHALKALTFTHKGKVDVIYIDPPYNTGAKDWKYNNDYVGEDDLYRHSKWLAFMERRLLIAKELLNSNNSVLIVTIDEKEYLRLGLLLEQMFPEAYVQMVSSVINPKGNARTNYFSRTDEFIFFVFFGECTVPDISIGGSAKPVRWRYFRRTDVESARGTIKGGPSQFYPIYVNNETHQIEKIGEPLPHGVCRNKAPQLEGCTAVFPIREDDEMEMNWGLVGGSLKKALEQGYVRVSKNLQSELQPYIFSYLTRPNIKKVEEGKLVKLGKRDDGSWDIVDPKGKSGRPTTHWRETSHEAGAHGTTMLRKLIPGRKFPYPKSLYAVEHVLDLFLQDKPHSIVIDFFAGSGTTAHAVMKVNKDDGGHRQCISITNNEVSYEEAVNLRKKGLRPGDESWENLGICDYITKPRIKAAITGIDCNNESIKGDYKFSDEFPISEGFNENAEFFTLTYEAREAVSHNLAFSRIAPLLWLRAGALGSRIDKLPSEGWSVVETYGVLIELDQANSFIKAIQKSKTIKVAYIVTDDDRRFQTISKRLPKGVEPVRLYESYITNFSFTNGE